MGSTCPRKSKTQETETNGGVHQIDPSKDKVSSTNSMDSASVQAKMSLDLIVEQLKREMSLKDMEDDQEQRIVLTNSMTMDDDDDDDDDDDAVGPQDFFPNVFEEKITKKKENGAAGMTDPIEINLKKKLEEKERKEVVGQILSGVVKYCGREEEKLYGLIRSMIAAEVKRYEERERKLLRKVHSDTTDVVGRKMNKRTFLLLNEEKKEDKTNPSKISKYDKVEEKNLTKNRMEKDKNVELPWTFAEERKINEEENNLTEETEDEEKESKDVATQTERAYTIRAVKSCPLRKRRIYRGVVGDARHKTELLGWIHRKASDNLIYEKSKASGSPSYVPLTERFRWRYVSARKAR